MSVSDIQLVNMNFADSETALHAGQVDAIISPGSNAYRLMDAKDRSIYSTDDLPSSRALSVIVATNKFIADHPSFFNRYYQVRQKALAWANAHLDEAYSQLATASGPATDAKVIAKLYPGPTLSFDTPITPDLIARLQATGAFLTDNGLARQAVDVPAWINQSVAYKAQ